MAVCCHYTTGRHHIRPSGKAITLYRVTRGVGLCIAISHLVSWPGDEPRLQLWYSRRNRTCRCGSFNHTRPAPRADSRSHDLHLMPLSGQYQMTLWPSRIPYLAQNKGPPLRGVDRPGVEPGSSTSPSWGLTHCRNLSGPASEWQVSNLRPLAPKASALPTAPHSDVGRRNRSPTNCCDYITGPT